MFTNEEILRVALEQSAIDSNCNWEDFLKKDNVIERLCPRSVRLTWKKMEKCRNF